MTTRRIGRYDKPLALATMVALFAIGLAACSSGSPDDDGKADSTPSATPSDSPSATAPSSPRVDQGPCTLSRALVPTCGAWWGSSRAPGALPTCLRWKASCNDRCPLRTSSIATVVPSPTLTSSPLRINGNRRVCFSETSNQVGPRPASSSVGQTLPTEVLTPTWMRLLRSIIAFDQPVFLAIHHEPEDDVIATPGSGFTADDYIAMYQYVVERVDATIARDGSPSTGYPIWVWDVTGYPRWESLWPQLYPGDRYVDWVGYNPYLQEPAGCDFSCVANRTYDNFPGWPGFYDWAVEEFPGKPLMLGEWGVRESTLDGEERAKAEVFLSAPELLATRFPELKALIYFNDGKALVDPTSSRIETSGAALDAFRTMVDDPYLRQGRLLPAPRRS